MIMQKWIFCCVSSAFRRDVDKTWESRKRKKSGHGAGTEHAALAGRKE